MARLLVIHHDTASLRHLAGMVRGHEFMAIDNLFSGVKAMPKVKPDVIIVGHDQAKRDGLRLLKYLRENQLKTPVVVVLSAGAGVDQPMLMKLGAKSLHESPVATEELNKAVDAAMARQASDLAGPCPITDEELNSNLSVLENQLNKHMRCFAGKNQVFIHSQILGGGARTKPRIALKCPLRAEYGLSRDVYFEFIKDACCGHPARCEAYRRFAEDRKAQE